MKMKQKMIEIIKLLHRIYDEVKIVVIYSFGRVSDRNRFNFQVYRKLNLPLWYHNFIAMGIKTKTYRDISCEISQQDKEPILFKMIEKGSEIARTRKLKNSPLTLVDLFCADAYFSIYALHRALVDFAVGIDIEEGSGEGFIRGGVLDHADTIRKICKLEKQLELRKCDVNVYEGIYDICLCIGGLYHIEDPLGLLKRITDQTSHVLVIQTVIPANISENNPFFVSPAPHWTWGSRFNKKYLIDSLTTMGWTVNEEDVRPLRANIHEWDKLSLSLLCTKNNVDQ